MQRRRSPAIYSNALRPLGASSKLNAEWRFLRHLRDIGRDAARRWMHAHHDAVGRHGTLDLRQMAPGPPASPRGPSSGPAQAEVA